MYVLLLAPADVDGDFQFVSDPVDHDDRLLEDDALVDSSLVFCRYDLKNQHKSNFYEDLIYDCLSDTMYEILNYYNPLRLFRKNYLARIYLHL